MIGSEDAQTFRLPQVVVIGGGFAGLHVVKGLRGAPCAVTLIDRTNHTVFAPLLYQVATAALNEDDIATPLRKVLRNQKNVSILMDEVRGIDQDRKVVSTIHHEIPYEYLVVAVGVKSNYFGHPEWSKTARSLKTLDDAISIRNQLLESFELAQTEEDLAVRSALLTCVLVGGGPTGVEMAGAIAELTRETLARGNSNVRPDEMKVILVEGSPTILNSFADDLAIASQEKLKSLGVELRLGGHVEDVTPEGVTIKGEFVPCRNVIWAAGMSCTGPKEWLQSETDRAGRLLVEPNLLVKGSKDVYAAGDAACILGTDQRPLPGVAQVAMQSGAFVASQIRARILGQSILDQFNYKDLGNMATIGRAFAIAEIRGLKFKGFVGWAMWLFIHIFHVSTFRSRISVMFRWFWAYFTRDRSATVLVLKEP